MENKHLGKSNRVLCVVSPISKSTNMNTSIYLYMPKTNLQYCHRSGKYHNIYFYFAPCFATCL